MPGRDIKTKFQGVFARHQEKCKATETGTRKDCNCQPSYYGTAWDRDAGKPRENATGKPTRRGSQRSQ